VTANSISQDGAISAYLLSQNIIPPPIDPAPTKAINVCRWVSFLS